MSTADQEGEAETWKGREREGRRSREGPGERARGEVRECGGSRREGEPETNVVRHGGGDGRLEMGARASGQEADRHTLSERDTETQNEGENIQNERDAHGRREKIQRYKHRDTHLEIEAERPRDRERLNSQVRDGRTRC